MYERRLADTDDVPSTSPDLNPRYKTRRCRWYTENGTTSCPHGLRCAYAHGEAEREHYVQLFRNSVEAQTPPSTHAQFSMPTSPNMSASSPREVLSHGGVLAPHEPGTFLLQQAASEGGSASEIESAEWELNLSLYAQADGVSAGVQRSRALTTGAVPHHSPLRMATATLSASSSHASTVSSPRSPMMPPRYSTFNGSISSPPPMPAGVPHHQSEAAMASSSDASSSVSSPDPRGSTTSSAARPARLPQLSIQINGGVPHQQQQLLPSSPFSSSGSSSGDGRVRPASVSSLGEGGLLSRWDHHYRPELHLLLSPTRSSTDAHAMVAAAAALNGGYDASALTQRHGLVSSSSSISSSSSFLGRESGRAHVGPSTGSHAQFTHANGSGDAMRSPSNATIEDNASRLPGGGSTGDAGWTSIPEPGFALASESGSREHQGGSTPPSESGERRLFDTTHGAAASSSAISVLSVRDAVSAGAPTNGLGSSDNRSSVAQSHGGAHAQQQQGQDGGASGPPFTAPSFVVPARITIDSTLSTATFDSAISSSGGGGGGGGSRGSASEKHFTFASVGGQPQQQLQAAAGPTVSVSRHAVPSGQYSHAAAAEGGFPSSPLSSDARRHSVRKDDGSSSGDARVAYEDTHAGRDSRSGSSSSGGNNVSRPHSRSKGNGEDTQWSPAVAAGLASSAAEESRAARELQQQQQSEYDAGPFDQLRELSLQQHSQQQQQQLYADQLRQSPHHGRSNSSASASAPTYIRNPSSGSSNGGSPRGKARFSPPFSSSSSPPPPPPPLPHHAPPPPPRLPYASPPLVDPRVMPALQALSPGELVRFLNTQYKKQQQQAMIQQQAATRQLLQQAGVNGNGRSQFSPPLPPDNSSGSGGVRNSSSAASSDGGSTLYERAVHGSSAAADGQQLYEHRAPVSPSPAARHPSLSNGSYVAASPHHAISPLSPQSTGLRPRSHLSLPHERGSSSGSSGSSSGSHGFDRLDAQQQLQLLREHASWVQQAQAQQQLLEQQQFEQRQLVQQQAQQQQFEQSQQQHQFLSQREGNSNNYAASALDMPNYLTVIHTAAAAPDADGAAALPLPSSPMAAVAPGSFARGGSPQKLFQWAGVGPMQVFDYGAGTAVDAVVAAGFHGGQQSAAHYQSHRQQQPVGPPSGTMQQQQQQHDLHYHAQYDSTAATATLSRPPSAPDLAALPGAWSGSGRSCLPSGILEEL